MVTCPACKREIEGFKGTQDTKEHIVLSLDPEGSPQRIVMESENMDEDVWYCPSCDSCFPEEDAVKILHGEDPLKTRVEPDHDALNKEEEENFDDVIPEK